MVWLIVLAIATILAILAIVIRSGLMRVRGQVRQSWSGLDAILIERHDLLPGLLDSCARHMQYEQEALERVSRADTAVIMAAAREDIAALAAAEKTLQDSIARLLALADNYPQLCADPAFPGLRGRIGQLDEAIDERREHYNLAANLQNIRSHAFPHRLVARFIGLQPAALFE
ncbi:MAG TPA: LemA family protein [Steroidobacteraceae bacterium]|nr:LemA family protein [Steroidobacteraceae bacterium]